MLGCAFAAVLAGCAVTEAMVAAGWIFAGEKVTVLTVVTAVARPGILRQFGLL